MQMQHASKRYKRVMRMSDACATYNAQGERDANAKRATECKLDNAQAWQTQAHRSTHDKAEVRHENVKHQRNMRI
jgi:hypothetical protein